MPRKKDPAAVALGRKGGMKKVKKGFAMLSDERKSEISRMAVQARMKKRRKKKL